MKICLKKVALIGLLLIASFIFLTANNATAVNQPYLDYDGGFTYDASTGTLDFIDLVIKTIVYNDGGPPTIAVGGNYDPYNDPLIQGYYLIDSVVGYVTLDSFTTTDGVLFNSTGSSNFSLVADSTTYLTADLISFTVDHPTTNRWEVNILFDEWNIKNQTFPGLGSSEFIDELYVKNKYASGGAEPSNFSMSFTFNSPDTGFVVGGTDTFGSVAGTFAAAPEPVSSILFITGGVILAIRRFRKK